jgi:hypothetical protein
MPSNYSAFNRPFHRNGHASHKKHKKLKRGSADFELLCFFVAKNRLTSQA